MARNDYPSSRVASERTIAIARVVLAVTALFAVWIDPAEPAKFAGLTYSLYWAYVLYSVATALYTVLLPPGDWMPVVTQAVDVVSFSVFQYLTLGPSSPFFVYFVFSMFCGAVRWGWRGSLVTGGTVLLFYMSMAASIPARLVVPELAINRFVVRLAYLGVATGMLVYLGRYEARLRTEIERLARWPAPVEKDPEVAIGRVLEYAASLMQAGCVLAVWESRDEPIVHDAFWSPRGTTVKREISAGLRILTDDKVRNATFICTGPVREATTILVAEQGRRLVRRDGMPIQESILSRLTGDGLATAAIQTDAIVGRVFFCDLGTPPAEAVPLTVVVTREIAASLDQLHSAQQREEIAAREERIRVARDLHDGVLQALTGVRLELRAIANQRPTSPATLREQLVSLERALAMEQRELRFFISGLEPGSNQRIDRQSTLSLRLDSIRERLALEWKTPVTLRVTPPAGPIPESIEEAVPLMVHEAAVNALKHAQPSRVLVDVESGEGQLRISVADDGQGFPFKGSYNHEQLAESQTAPRSLFDRVSALGGRLSIESSDRGSRVEMVLSL